MNAERRTPWQPCKKCGVRVELSTLNQGPYCAACRTMYHPPYRGNERAYYRAYYHRKRKGAAK